MYVNEQDSLYVFLPHVHKLVKTTHSEEYLGSIVGGGYVAKPIVNIQPTPV